MDVKMRRRSSVGPRRVANPRLNPNRKSTSALPSMDRASMLVMEANEIAACLGKDYVFSKVADLDANEDQSEVKITHQKWKISCVWSLDKLKGRLVRMRKLIYASDSDSMECEAVFFDPNDAWTKDDSGRASSPQSTGPLEHSSALLPINPNISTGKQPTRHIWSKGFDSPPRNREVKKPAKLSLIQPPSSRGSPDYAGDKGNCDIENTDFHIVHSPQKVIHSHILPEFSDIMQCRNHASVLRDDNRRGSAHSDTLDYVPEKDTNSRISRDSITRQGSLRSTSSGTELPGDSLFLLDTTSAESTTSDLHAALPAKYMTDSADGRVPNGPLSPVVECSSTACQTDRRPAHTSILTHCKRFLTTTRDRLKVPKQHHEFVDKILANCELVKVAVINVFEGFTQAQETGEGTACFIDGELMRTSSLQLVAGTELLTSHCDMWTATLDDLDSSLAHELRQNLSEAVFHLSDDLLLFLEACENDDEDGVAESAGRLVDDVYDVCRHTGQMALAVGANPAALVEPEPSINDLLSLDDEDADTSNKPGVDLKQSLLDGYDHHLTSAFLLAQQTLEDYLSRPLTHSEDGHNNKVLTRISECTQTVVARVQALVQHCRHLQDDLNSHMRKDCEKPEQYFSQYCMRVQALFSQIQHVANCTALLHQAQDCLQSDVDSGNLRKLHRCSEILQKSGSKVITSTSCMIYKVKDDESQSSASAPAPHIEDEKSIVLSDRQFHKVGRIGKEFSMALDELIRLVKDTLSGDTMCTNKTRRMLPATPGTKGLVRCQSARCPDKKRISRHLSMLKIGTSSEA